MNPDQIREAIAYLDAFLRAMPYDADGNVRSMEADEQTRFDEGLAERERLAGLLAQHERVQALAPVNGVPGDAPAPFNVNRNADPFDLSDLRYDATASEVRGRAVTALEQVRGLADADRAHVTELVERRGGEVIGRVLATGSDAYRSAAAKLMTGNAHMLDDAERAAVVRAQSLADAEGGYAVPFTLDPTIMLTNAGAESAIRQLARTATITTNAWNGVSSAGTSVTYHGEAEEVGDDSITLAQPTVPVHRYDVFIPYSFEAGQDWQGFEGDMRMVMQDARARKDVEIFTLGTGSDQPTGFVTALAAESGSVVTPTTAETFAVADLYKVEESLGDRFLGNAAWQANRAIFNDVRQFDTTGGANLWERLGAGTPSELIGYPAYRNSAMDSGFNAAATANNYILAFGDWKAGFLIVERVGMNFEVVPHLFHTANNRPSGQRGFLAWGRNGSDVIVPEALRLLNVATAA